MKPQCETAADCLRELARVMDQLNIERPLDAINSDYVKYALTEREWQIVPEFNEPSDWSFAIAEVEGKPIFIGDKLYDWKGDAHTVPYLNDGSKMDLRKGCEWTWTPPKPKTVMVEMLVEDAEYYAANENDRGQRLNRHIAACKKALEELK